MKKLRDFTRSFFSFSTGFLFGKKEKVLCNPVIIKRDVGRKNKTIFGA